MRYNEHFMYHVRFSNAGRRDWSCNRLGGREFAFAVQISHSNYNIEMNSGYPSHPEINWTSLTCGAFGNINGTTRKLIYFKADSAVSKIVGLHQEMN
jgi:hypothetical protein